VRRANEGGGARRAAEPRGAGRSGARADCEHRDPRVPCPSSDDRGADRRPSRADFRRLRHVFARPSRPPPRRADGPCIGMTASACFVRRLRHLRPQGAGPRGRVGCHPHDRSPIGFTLRFPQAQVPRWAERYRNAANDGALRVRLRPGVLWSRSHDNGPGGGIVP
jgi:hypothetical protein